MEELVVVVCVCVCERERETERERDKERNVRDSVVYVGRAARTSSKGAAYGRRPYPTPHIHNTIFGSKERRIRVVKAPRTC
jgi:hypothetical protein